MTVLPVPVAETSRLRWCPRSRASAICSSKRSWNGSGRSSIGLKKIRGLDARTSGFGGKRHGVIRDEIAAVPIALEHRGDLVDDVGVSRARHADVPFEAADLR